MLGHRVIPNAEIPFLKILKNIVGLKCSLYTGIFFHKR